MNLKTLPLSILCLGIVSLAFAATERVSGEIVDDLQFANEVKIMGIEYPEDMGDDKGTSSVELKGDGSVTIYSRSGGGFPRIVLWGNTKIESERDWLQDVIHKDWWAGIMAAPSTGRLVDVDELEFDISGNHTNSELVVLETFAFGRNDSTVAETFKFSPAATVVLPLNVPDFTKVWVAFRDGPDMEEIEEDSFCVVQNKLCIVEVSSANEISLVREKYEDCPIDVIDNGTVGATPYCVYKCDKGYVYNEGMTECVKSSDEDALAVMEAASVDAAAAEGENEEVLGVLAGPARQGYLRYTGTNAQKTKIDTDELRGEELQRALRHNATVNSRVRGNEVVAKLDADSGDGWTEEKWNLWKWATRNEGKGAMSDSLLQDSVIADGGTSVDAPVHGSAPMLPSTGPAGLFVGISALGFGLMAFSRRRRR